MRTLAATGIALGLALSALPANAEPWVQRSLTLSRADFRLGLGLGIGHDSRPAREWTGLGLDLDFGAGLGHMLELGFRTGVRFGRDGRATGADVFGRTFDTETYGTGGDTLANPEVLLRWTAVRGSILELGLEGRVVLPFDDSLTLMFAVPLRVHIGGVARLDTGVYVPITFHDDPDTLVSIPFHLWFQVDGRFFLGPLTEVRLHDGGNSVPLGFGLGWGLSYDVDLESWILFPNVSGSGQAKHFGVGLALQIRF